MFLEIIKIIPEEVSSCSRKHSIAPKEVSSSSRKHSIASKKVSSFSPKHSIALKKMISSSRKLVPLIKIKSTLVHNFLFFSD